MKKNNPSTEKEALKDDEGSKVVINPDVEPVDKKTLKKYRVHWYQKIPYPVRALFIKYWFFGLNYFLFDVGLGSLEFFQNSNLEFFTYATLIMMLVSGTALGAFNEVFVYNILDAIEDYPGEKNDYVFFKSKKLYSLFINVLYGILIGFLSRLVSGNLTKLIDPSLNSFWFREPFTCALVMFVLDASFVFVKNLLVLLYHRFIHPENQE